jgi:hypothetical protein
VCRTPIDREVNMPTETSCTETEVCVRRAPVYDFVCAPKTEFVPVVDTADRICPVPGPCGTVRPKLTTVAVGTHLEQVAVGTQAVRIPVGAREVTIPLGERDVSVRGMERRIENFGHEIHLVDRGQVVEKREIRPGRWVAEPTQVPVPGYWVMITCDPAQADGREVLTRAQYEELVAGRR